MVQGVFITYLRIRLDSIKSATVALVTHCYTRATHTAISTQVITSQARPPMRLRRSSSSYGVAYSEGLLVHSLDKTMGYRLLRYSSYEMRTPPSLSYVC